MRERIERIVEHIKKEMETVEFVEGIVVYGSYARGELDAYSDIDMIVYTTRNAGDSSKKEFVKEKLKETIDSLEGGPFLTFDIDGKHTIYTNNSFLKLEVRIRKLSEIPDDIIFLKESRVDSPGRAIVLDKHGRIEQLIVEHWNNVKTDNVKEKFIENLYIFLYFYDGLMVQLSRGDAYRAYMNYAIAFFKLASLCAIVGGETNNMYQPWFLTNGVIKSRDKVRKLFDSSSMMVPSEMAERKEIMKDLLLDCVENGTKTLGLQIDIPKIRKFFEMARGKNQLPSVI